MRWLLGALQLVMFAGGAFAQANLPGAGTASGFNVTQYYPTPNFRQLEMKLTGAEATLVPGTAKQFHILKPALVSFEPNGAMQLTIATPECIFDDTDVKARRVGSLEPLAMRTGDGRFSITGRGFLWRQAEKILIISNEVHAVIQWTNNAPPLEITSRWFEFEAEQGRGVFHEEVRGEDTNQVFTCALLTIKGSLDKTNRKSFDWVEAEGGLEIAGKLAGRHATAQRGVYRRTEERVDLIGEAAWEYEGRSGRADRMTAWRTNQDFEAVGKVVLGMPREGLGAVSGLLSSTNAGGKSSGTNLVHVFAEHFTRRGDLVLAEGGVRVNDGTNQLFCDRLEGRQAPKKSSLDDTATATGHVFVERGGGGIHAERAEYSRIAGQIVFTGNPRFEQEQIHGTATRVMVRTLTNEAREVWAEDNVAVTFPLPAGGRTFLNVLPDSRTNRVAETNRGAQSIGITSKTFRLLGPKAVFAGDVRANELPETGSEHRMRCGELEIRIAPDQRHAESLQARQDVVCEQGIIGVTNGPSEYARMDSKTLTALADPATGDMAQLVAGGGVRFQQTDTEARGAQAVYTRADQLLKLIGQPTIKRPEVTYSSDHELTWDTARRTVIGSGYRILFNPEALKQATESKKLP